MNDLLLFFLLVALGYAGFPVTIWVVKKLVPA